jgi:hypothetical protein
VQESCDGLYVCKVILPVNVQKGSGHTNRVGEQYVGTSV